MCRWKLKKNMGFKNVAGVGQQTTIFLFNFAPPVDERADTQGGYVSLAKLDGMWKAAEGSLNNTPIFYNLPVFLCADEEGTIASTHFQTLKLRK